MTKWKGLEAVIERISCQLAPNAVVRRNVRLPDKAGGRGREFDVLIEVPSPFKNQLVAVECKDYGRRVSVDKVEAFHTKLGDCKLNQGIMVSPNGFTDGSLKKAHHHNIMLLSHRQAAEADWHKLVGPSSWFRFVQEAFLVESIGITTPDGEKWGVKFDSAIYTNDGQQYCPAIELAHHLIDHHPFMALDIEAKKKRQLGQQWLGSRVKFPDGPLHIVRYDEPIEIDQLIVNGKLLAHGYAINLAFGDGDILQEVLSGKDTVRSLHSAPFRVIELIRSQVGVELSPEEYATLGDSSLLVPPDATATNAQLRISFTFS